MPRAFHVDVHQLARWSVVRRGSVGRQVSAGAVGAGSGAGTGPVGNAAEVPMGARREWPLPPADSAALTTDGRQHKPMSTEID